MKKHVLLIPALFSYMILSFSQLYAREANAPRDKYHTHTGVPAHGHPAGAKPKDLRGISPLLAAVAEYRYNGARNYLIDTGTYTYSRGRGYSSLYTDWQFDTFTMLDYDTLTGSYQNANRYIQYYTVNNYDSIFIFQAWDTGTHSWLNTAMYQYTTNASGYVDTNVYSTWNAGSSTWSPYYRFIYTHNGNNQLIQELWQSWTAGAWTFYYEYNSAYDIAGNKIKEVDLIWNTVALAWDSSSLDIYNYDAQNDQISNSFQDYDSTNHVWDNLDQELISDFVNTHPQIYIDTEWDQARSAYDTIDESLYTYNADAYYYFLTYQEKTYVNGTFELIASDYSATYYYRADTTAGIAQISADDMRLYPNPASGTCHLSLTSALADGGTLAISDLTGRMVKTVTLSGSEATFSTADMSAGIYICMIESGGKIIGTRKLVVN